MMIELYSATRLTARQFSVMCGLCAKAGTPGGNFQLYGQEPGLQTGRYQQYLDEVLPETTHLVDVQVPMMQNRSPMRTIRHVPMRLVFESLADEMAENSSILEALSWKSQSVPHCFQLELLC